MEILKPLYSDIRGYLIAALDMPADDPVAEKYAPIVKGYNNNAPIPFDAIIMTFLYSGHLDQFSHEYVGDKMIIYNSVKGTMQIDFHGNNAHDKAQAIATLWNTPYTTSVLKDCVPLNQPRVRNLTFVNETGNYEPRFMIELDLQYNTKYEKQVNIATDVSQIDLESINVQFNSSE